MNYFGQVILEILENNQLKTHFGNSVIAISHFLKFVKGENLQNFVCKIMF